MQHIVQLYVEDCVAASENVLCFLMNVRLLLKDINEQLLLKEKKYASWKLHYQVPFYCIVAVNEISLTVNEFY